MKTLTGDHAPLSGSDRRFYVALAVIGGLYVLLLVAMLVADTAYTTPGHLWAALQSPEIRYAIRLSLLSCTITTLRVPVRMTPSSGTSSTSCFGPPRMVTLATMPGRNRACGLPTENRTFTVRVSVSMSG